MTNTPEPNQPDRDSLAQKVKQIDWRLRRIEATQIPASAIDESFQQVYDELDELHTKTDRIEGKIDTILQHLTGFPRENP
jgi:uncharacterized coiled-coil DUF342 family protein